MADSNEGDMGVLIGRVDSFMKSCKGGFSDLRKEIEEMKKFQTKVLKRQENQQQLQTNQVVKP